MDKELVKKYLPEYKEVFERSSISRSKPLLFIKSIEVITTPAEFSPSVSDTAYVHMYDYNTGEGILDDGPTFSYDSLANTTSSPYARLVDIPPGHRAWVAKYDGAMGGSWSVTVYARPGGLPKIVPQKAWEPGQYREDYKEVKARLTQMRVAQSEGRWAEGFEDMKTRLALENMGGEEDIADILHQRAFLSDVEPVLKPENLIPTRVEPAAPVGSQKSARVRIVKGLLAGRTGIVQSESQESYGVVVSVLIDGIGQQALVNKGDIEEY